MSGTRCMCRNCERCRPPRLRRRLRWGISITAFRKTWSEPSANSSMRKPTRFWYRRTRPSPANVVRITELAAKARLPATYGDRRAVEAGGLLSYGPNVVENYRRSAIYVDKILKGAKPAELPVEQPTKIELVINLKTAK